MKDIPIIFSGPMVRALLDGRKTMTRRLLYSARTAKNGVIPASASVLMGMSATGRQFIYEPVRSVFEADINTYWALTGWHKCKPGDRLWVRESLTRSGGLVQYLANTETSGGTWPGSWKQDPRPSIHMPRGYSRLTLIVTGVKIERLQAISEADAMAEGAEPILVPPDGGGAPHVEGFMNLWRSLHGADSWGANPWVVALTFTVQKHNIDALSRAAA